MSTTPSVPGSAPPPGSAVPAPPAPGPGLSATPPTGKDAAPALAPYREAAALLLVIAGGALLVLADTLARSVVAPQQLPVGLVTALLRVPSFLVLLLGRWK